MAPEAIAGTAYDAPKLGVFALGRCIPCLLRPAAGHTIEELHQKCYQGRGLRNLGGHGPAPDRKLQGLISLVTAASVEDRLDSVRDFLDLLDGVEMSSRHPLLKRCQSIDARVNDRLAGGSSSRSAWAKDRPVWPCWSNRDGKRRASKLRWKPSLNARLSEEGQILRRLHHANIVELYDQTEISGHVALFMALAGVDIKSGALYAAQRLRLEGRLSLDLLQRFGEELLVVADWLEQNGISYRDIKTDNIGVGRRHRQIDADAVRLFSGQYPADNLRAGTPPYLIPSSDGVSPTLGSLCRALRHRHDAV